MADSDELLPADEKARQALLAHTRHELLTPINAIVGYAELLLDDAEECGYQPFVKDLQRIRAAGHELLGMINSLQDAVVR